MRGSREILKDSESRLLKAIEGISSDVSDLLLLAEKVLASAQTMENETSAVLEQIHQQWEGGRKKAKIALSEKNTELAREALRHALTVELEAKRLSDHSGRVRILTRELSRWCQELQKMQEDLSAWTSIWKERRGRAVIFPSLTVLGRMMRRMIRATSIIDRVNETADLLKVDIEGLERLRAEAEPAGETFGRRYRMSSETKSKLEARLREEMAKLRAEP